jgi:hypothetical protein
VCLFLWRKEYNLEEEEEEEAKKNEDEDVEEVFGRIKSLHDNMLFPLLF